MGFKSLTIEHFRSIKYLHINDLSHVNLITGKNNSGKSTILEAFFLSVGITNPQLAVNIHNFRNLILTEDEDFRFLFTNLSDRELPVISSYVNKKKRVLKISPLYSEPFARISNQEIKEKSKINNDNELSLDASASHTDRSDMTGLEFNAQIDKKQIKTEFSLLTGQIIRNTDFRDNVHASYLTPATIMTNLQNRLSKIIVNKDLEKILSVLKIIEPNLNDIKLGANGNIYADIGIDQLIPINIMGDGIRRVLSILVYIYERKHGILFIDEIENGLHYSSLEVLWKAIKKASVDNDVQIFVSTHSQDCVNSFSNVFNENDDASLIKIERRENEHITKKIDNEALNIALSNNFEVR